MREHRVFLDKRIGPTSQLAFLSRDLAPVTALRKPLSKKQETKGTEYNLLMDAQRSILERNQATDDVSSTDCARQMSVCSGSHDYSSIEMRCISRAGSGVEPSSHSMSRCVSTTASVPYCTERPMLDRKPYVFSKHIRDMTVRPIRAGYMRPTAPVSQTSCYDIQKEIPLV